MEWFVSNLGYFCMLILTLASATATFIVTLKTKGAGSAVKSALQVVYKMLPSLITTSENVNRDKTGAEKKAFVMTFVENTLAGRGLTMTEAITEEISASIDAIVACTKTMHTEKSTGVKVNEENSGNDATGATGLRVTA